MIRSDGNDFSALGYYIIPAADLVNEMSMAHQCVDVLSSE
jgi:hypothetical protein